MKTTSSMYNVILNPIFFIAHIGFNIIFSLYSALLFVYRDFVSFLSQGVQNKDKTKSLVIIGGGFAGAYAAKKLEDHFKVTLIDSKDYFEFTPSVLRTIVNPNHVEKIQIRHQQYLDLKKVTVVNGSVSNMKTNSVTVQRVNEVESAEISFDYAFISTGSTYAVPFKEMNVVVAQRGSTLSRSYQLLEDSNRILIIGGGIVGVELAAEIVEQFPNKNITIVQAGDHLMSKNQVSKKGVDHCYNFLKSRGVNIMLNERVEKKEGTTKSFSRSFSSLKGNVFMTNQGNLIESDLTFLCTGIQPNSDFLKHSDLSESVDKNGFVCVNDYLQLKGFNHIFAAGDVTDIKEEKLAQNAESTSHVAVENMLKFSLGEQKKMKKYSTFGRIKLISLGKRDGVATYNDYALTGFITAIMKEFVESMIMTSYRYLSGRFTLNHC